MDLEFRNITAADAAKMIPYYKMRKNNTCDSVFLESFIWKEYYQVRYAIWENRALLWLMEENGSYFSGMPLCREEDLPEAFGALERYFNEVLHQPLIIHLADEYGVRYLQLPEERYLVREQKEARDYLYQGDALRRLSGRKLHKKKNRLNTFLRQYEGRFEYRKICCSNMDEVWKFLDKWRLQKGEEVEAHLDYEVRGIHDILRNCSSLDSYMGGIYIDGSLEAFSIGSYNPLEEMAVIHIEKANPRIPGLYQAINQMFLANEFPQAKWVNREDDMGLEGLRKAKMSYNPADFARKYLVVQRINTTEIHYLTREQKGATIPLWKECFPEDSPSFIDYYYQEKTKKNQILVKEENGEILSMLQRNPYHIQMKKHQWNVDYLVGVATKKSRRGEGHMRSLLVKCLRDMCLEQMPFTFLMPAAEGIYRPFDFRFIWEKTALYLEKDRANLWIGTPIEKTEAACKEAAAWMNRWLQKRYQLYTLRDGEYVETLVKELESEGGELSMLYENEEPAGLIAHWGIHKREQRLLYTEESWCRKGEKKPVIMARITNLYQFLTGFALKEEGNLTVKLEVTDGLIPENHGSFLWSLHGQDSTLEAWEEKDLAAAAALSEDFVFLQTSISQLAQWLFGYRTAGELWKELSETELHSLEKVDVVSGVFLDEIV